MIDNSLIVTKASKNDVRLSLDCKALSVLYSGKIGEDIWKREFLFSYKAGEDNQYLKKGVFSLFVKEENKEKRLIQTGKMYHLEVICNAKKAKNHWVNNLDIVSIEEIEENN